MVWSFAGAVSDDTMRLTGTDGEITLTMFKSEPVRLMNGSGTQLFDLPYPPHVAQPLIQTVVDDLLGRGSCPSTGVSARRTSQVMDRVLEACCVGRTDAFWSRPRTWPGLRTG